MARAVPDFGYRSRSRDGLVFRKPRRLNAELAKVIRARYFNREATQLQLALEYGVRQCTISKVVSLQVYANIEARA